MFLQAFERISPVYCLIWLAATATTVTFLYKRHQAALASKNGLPGDYHDAANRLLTKQPVRRRSLTRPSARAPTPMSVMTQPTHQGGPSTSERLGSHWGVWTALRQGCIRIATVMRSRVAADNRISNLPVASSVASPSQVSFNVV
ncbi:hypothetical protein OG21DRAFT_1510539 [Imleria badia]|nr:hypothetical protein OG21DRAFT_1510539 [Imleria badia]